MKKLLIILLLVTTCSSFAATNYYVSATGSDANNGTSTSTPIQTLTKVAALSLVSGDSVLFKRGDTIVGRLRTFYTGVTYAAYGTGALPVLSGQATVSGFTSVGTNLWESAALTNVTIAKLVAFNDVPAGQGRTPNTTDSGGGYKYFEYVNGTGQISDNQLSATPNFTNASIVLKQNAYTLGTYPITSHAGTFINFTGNTSVIKNNQGYFFTNSLLTLDQQNEWYFNATTKKLTVYSTTMPTNVKVSTIDTIFSIISKNNIVIKNIDFEGANKNAISLSNTSGIQILNCKINNSGVNAIQGRNSQLFTISGCIITNSFNDGLSLGDINNATGTIRNNYIWRSGALPQMIGSTGNGITITGNNHIIEHNHIDSSAASGIYITRANNTYIHNNDVNVFCFVKSDGGGIYTWNNFATPIDYSNNRVVGNIIRNGVGTCDGISNKIPDVDGIYMDDNTKGWDIIDNVSYSNAGSGMYIHNNQNMNIQGNTIYNNSREQVNFTYNLAKINGVASPYTTPLRNITFKNNIIFSRTASQIVFTFSSIENDFTSIGTMDSNYYTRPINESRTIQIAQTASGTLSNKSYNLTTYKAAFPSLDVHTKAATKTVTTSTDITFPVNRTTAAITSVLPYNYIDVAGNPYNGTITLQGFTGKPLIKSSANTLVKSVKFLNKP